MIKPHNKIIFLILAIGLIVRIALFINFFNHPTVFYDDDSASYLNISKNIITGRGFVYQMSEPYDPDTHRTPGYPLFLIFHKFVFGNYYSALITQIFISVGIAYLIFVFGKKYGDVHLGYIAAIVFLFMPFSLLITLKYMTQVLFTATLTLATWSWLNFLEKKNKIYLFLTAILIPTTVHIRPVSQYIVIIFILSFLYYFWLNKNHFKRKMLYLVPSVLLALFFLILFPWQYRNYKEFGKYEMSSILWIQMYFYDVPDIYARANNISYEKASDILFKQALSNIKMNNDNPTPADVLSPFESWSYLKKESIAIMIDNPLAFVESRAILSFKFFIRDGIRAWFDDISPDWRNSSNSHNITDWRNINLFIYSMLLERLFLSLLLIGTVTAFWMAFYMEPTKRFLIHFSTAIVLYFSATVGIMASALHRFQAEPFYILVGLIGLSIIFGKIKKLLIGKVSSS